MEKNNTVEFLSNKNLKYLKNLAQTLKISFHPKIKFYKLVSLILQHNEVKIIHPKSIIRFIQGNNKDREAIVLKVDRNNDAEGLHIYSIKFTNNNKTMYNKTHRSQFEVIEYALPKQKKIKYNSHKESSLDEMLNQTLFNDNGLGVGKGQIKTNNQFVNTLAQVLDKNIDTQEYNEDEKEPDLNIQDLDSQEEEDVKEPTPNNQDDDMDVKDTVVEEPALYDQNIDVVDEEVKEPALTLDEKDEDGKVKKGDYIIIEENSDITKANEDGEIFENKIEDVINDEEIKENFEDIKISTFEFFENLVKQQNVITDVSNCTNYNQIERIYSLLGIQ